MASTIMYINVLCYHTTEYDNLSCIVVHTALYVMVYRVSIWCTSLVYIMKHIMIDNMV